MTQEQLNHQGRLIRKSRERKNMAQGELAERLHVTKQAVSNWENGNNSIDEGIVPVLEKVLGISLSTQTAENIGGFGMSKDLHPSYVMKNLAEFRSKKELYPLEVIERLENSKVLYQQMLSAVKQVEVDDAYASTVRRMLRRLLSVVLGYEVYYLKHVEKAYEEDPLTWQIIASDLRDVVNCRKYYPIPEQRDPASPSNRLVRRKIQYMVTKIESSLYEDYDESGDLDGYEQQVGCQGVAFGNELLDTISDENNSMMMSFKMAVHTTACVIENIR